MLDPPLIGVATKTFQYESSRPCRQLRRVQDPADSAIVRGEVEAMRMPDRHHVRERGRIAGITERQR